MMLMTRISKLSFLGSWTLYFQGMDMPALVYWTFYA